MRQSVSQLLLALKRGSKRDDIPGTVITELSDPCPICGRKMKKYKPCCGSPTGYKGCNCGYKINITSDSM